MILLFILAACTDKGSHSNTITVADLSDREDVILSTITDQAFVFDFNVDSEYEEVTVRMEKYEFGQLVEQSRNELTAMVEETGSTVFSASKTSDESNEKIFYIGVGGKRGSVSNMKADKEIVDVKNMSSVWGNFSESKTFEEGKEIVLASIGYSSSESGVSSFNNDFYDNMEAHMDELEEFDIALVLKAEFTK